MLFSELETDIMDNRDKRELVDALVDGIIDLLNRPPRMRDSHDNETFKAAYEALKQDWYERLFHGDGDEIFDALVSAGMVEPPEKVLRWE